MAIITVCIPAFDSEKFLMATLDSVQNQSFKDFSVKIALEPTENCHETIAICEKYLSDKRFLLSLNSSVLGWAENIDQLLKQIDTPYFIILPHDDIIHPDYLSLLYSEIIDDGEIAVCYGDMQFFGGHGGQKSREFDNQTLFSRLSSFYLLGAEAVPWRGVTSTKVLDAGYSFPTNKWNSLWVECEWAQLLLKCGKAVRVPKSIYFKRIFPPGRTSVSRNWFVEFDATEKINAAAHHRNAMLAGFSGDIELDRDYLKILRFCHELAMVRRIFPFIPAQAETLIGELMHLEEEVRPLTFSLKHKVVSRIYLLLSQMAGHQGDISKSVRYAQKALEGDSTNAEAYCHYAELLLSRSEPEYAITYINKATSLALNTPWAEALIHRFQQQMKSNNLGE